MIKYVGVVCAFLMISTFVHAAPKATKEEHQALQQKVMELEQLIKLNQQQVASKQALITLKMELNIMREELQSLRSENERLRYEINIIQNRQKEALTAIDRKIIQLTDGDNVTLRSPQVISGEGIINDNRIDNLDTSDTLLQGAVEQSQTQADTSQLPAETPLPDQVQLTATAEGNNGETDDQQAILSQSVTMPEVDMKAALSAYRDAFVLLKQNQHEQAIQAFQAFLVSYPNTKYSANAQYWLGEANYVAKYYEIALEEFQKVLDIYPDSSKIPDARLKIGYTQYELEQWSEARATLGRLRAQLPDTKVAGLAQQRLERMDREGH